MSRFASPPITDLNTTPLIDVMLVLLIIFMIAAPVVAHRVPLPAASAAPSNTSIPPVIIDIAAEAGAGAYRLDDVPIARTDLLVRIRQWAALAPAQQPTVHIRAGEEVPFDTVATLLADGQRAGVLRFGLSE
jgi:biopolymer transport protein ExbD